MFSGFSKRRLFALVLLGLAVISSSGIAAALNSSSVAHADGWSCCDSMRPVVF